MNTYPIIGILISCKRFLPSGAALLTIIAGVWVSYRTGVIDWTVASAVAAAVFFFLVRSYIEVLEVISDTLIPR